VRAYHGVLERLKIKPRRSLEDDMQLQTAVMSYGGSAAVSVPARMPARVKTSTSGGAAQPAAQHDCGCGGTDPAQCHCHDTSDPSHAQTHRSASSDGQPDFSRMTTAEKLAYNKAKRDRIFG
jgi:hypothetical protein